MKLRVKSHWLLALGVVALLGAGCASTPPPENRDPWQAGNRKVFQFNEGLDKWVLNPVAEAWNFIFPDPVQDALGRAFDNLNMPRVFVNDVLQGRPVAAGKSLFRFTLNSTFGWAGLFDVAGDVGFPLDDSDFGQTLGVWGVPTGPYVHAPVLGPFTVRSGTGFVADIFMVPWTYLVPGIYSMGVTVARVVNLRAAVDDELEAAREDALDYYVFVRDAYMQFRDARVNERLGPEAQRARDEDLYSLDDEDYDVFEDYE